MGSEEPPTEWAIAQVGATPPISIEEGGHGWQRTELIPAETEVDSAETAPDLAETNLPPTEQGNA